MGVVGLILHCTFIAFYYFFYAALVAPYDGKVLLFIVWASLLALCLLLLVRSRLPGLALAIPFLAAGAWIGIVALGENVLGWEA